MKQELLDCFRLLDVPPDATLQEIRASYRILVKVWHPDRHQADPGLQAKASRKLADINRAYEVVCRTFEVSAPPPAAPRPTRSAKRSPAAETPRSRVAVISDDGTTRIEEHIDVACGTHRFTVKTRRSDYQKSRLGFQYRQLFTQWVPLTTDLREAIAVSRSFQTEPHNGERGTHADYVDGGYSWEYSFADGSRAEVGFEVDPRSEQWHALVAAGELDKALELAKDLATIHPTAPSGYVFMAYSLHAVRRTLEARQVLSQVASEFPDERYIAYNLACYECVLGNLDQAKTWLKKAKKIAGKDEIRKSALADPDLVALRPYVSGPIWW